MITATADIPALGSMADIGAVRFLWSDGRAEVIGPAQTPYLHPILARLRPS